jgi:hypothetical protein
MSITMSEIIRMDELVRIVDVFDQKVKGTDRDYFSNFTVLDRCPENLPLMEDVIRDYESGNNYFDNDIVIVLARIGDLMSSPYYNRILELKYGNHRVHLANRGGFSYGSADTLSGFYRPGQKFVSVTKGNNRVSMLYGVTQDLDARIAISLKFHSRDLSVEEMIRVESNDHNVDANYRTNQTGDHRFKSAFYARDPKAVALYEFCAKFNIGIAGTLPDAAFHAPRHTYIANAVKDAQGQTERYLKAFTENDCSKEIGGSCTLAGAMFLKYFSKYINKVDELNSCDSFAGCLRYYFCDWGDKSRPIYGKKARNVTQEDITGATTDYKKWEPAVARFVCLYNAYVDSTGLEFPGNQQTAIPFNGSDTSCWVKFISSANSLIRPQLQNIAEQRFF